jgi:hypothetical protein
VKGYSLLEVADFPVKITASKPAEPERKVDFSGNRFQAPGVLGL